MFIDIVAVRANFCMKFYTTVKDRKYTLPPSFIEIYVKMIKLSCFIQDIPIFKHSKHHASKLSQVH